MTHCEYKIRCPVYEDYCESREKECCKQYKEYFNQLIEKQRQRALDDYPAYLFDIHLAHVINEGRKKVDKTSKLEWEGWT